MNSTLTGQVVPETSPAASASASKVQAAARVRYCPGNSPQTVWDYLMYPRVLLTAIICVVSTIMHIAFGIYVWFFT